jgi:hypothetical protein
VRRRMGGQADSPEIRHYWRSLGDPRNRSAAAATNVSRGGALIHSHVPLPSQSVHRLGFPYQGQDVSVPVRVSHVNSQVSADGERTYLIGVEFVSANPALLHHVEQWVATGRDEVAGV